MESHELRIEIGKEGKVRLETSGAKGKSCLEYMKLVEQIVGKALGQELTQEYYEPDSRVEIQPAQQQKQQQKRQG
ncbi:MAG TPA: DUF2997 domain-containing protein [Planctomycetota bacterium]|nr:DUF2997 domain-containing protein [Planctomycetota bacterium]